MQKCNHLKGTSNYINEDFREETLGFCRKREKERERERKREREKERKRERESE